MDHADPTLADRLDAHLDGVVGRLPPRGGLDPALAETVRRLHGLAAETAPRPDPIFVARLEADLMTDSRPTFPTPPFLAANGHAAAARLATFPAPREASRWPITEVMVAAVLLLAVSVALAAHRSGPPSGAPGEGETQLGAPLPAASPTLAGPVAGTFRMTVSEGRRVEEIALEFARSSSMEDGDDAFMAALDEVDRGRYGFLSGLPAATSLEGYLLPGTYDVADDDPLSNVYQMLDAFDAAFAPEMRQRARDMNLSIAEVVTLASIVERDTAVPAERPIIADIYIKRWEQAADGWKLEADPTVQYAVAPEGGEWWPELSEQDLFVEDPYNTYQNAGLPPGPICNPGSASIQAVLFPEATPYYFFVATGDESGTHSFATTAEEQAANVERYRENIGAEGRTASPAAVPPAATPLVPSAAFAPTHQVSEGTINLRPAPSFDDQPLAALPTGTPLETFGEETPGRDGTTWMRFRTEDGLDGWIQDIDVRPFGAVSDAVPPPTVDPLAAGSIVDAEAGAGALEPNGRTETFQTDPDALLAGDPAAIEQTQVRLREVLAKYGDGCRAGFALITGNGDVGEGHELARAVLDILRTDFPVLFGDVTAEEFAQPGVEPRGEVTLEIFFYQGCRTGS